MDNVFSLLLQISSFSQIVQHIWFVLTLSPQNTQFFQFMMVIMFIVIIGFKLMKFVIGLCIYYHFTNIKKFGKFENIFLYTGTVSSVVFFVKKKLFYTSFYTSLYCSYIKLSIFQRKYFVFQ